MSGSDAPANRWPHTAISHLGARQEITIRDRTFSVIPAFFWRESRLHKAPGFPPGTCGNDGWRDWPDDLLLPCALNEAAIQETTGGVFETEEFSQGGKAAADREVLPASQVHGSTGAKPLQGRTNASGHKAFTFLPEGVRVARVTLQAVHQPWVFFPDGPRCQLVGRGWGGAVALRKRKE